VIDSPTAVPSVVAPAAERRGALAERHPTWAPLTLPESLDAAVQRWAERPLVITDSQTWSYADIRAWSLRIAAGLREMGVGPGDRVAVILANVPEFVALRYAVSRLGAAVVPVNFLFRARELAYVLAQSGAVALVTMDAFRAHDYLELLDQIAEGWQDDPSRLAPTLRDVVVVPLTGGRALPARPHTRALADVEALAGPGRDEVFTDAPVDVSGVCDILYTSGTTGQPKGVILTHDMVVRTAYAAAYHGAMPDGNRILFSLPMYHVFGYIECLLAATFVGGAIIPLAQFSPPEFLTAVERHRATEIVCVPTMTLGLIAEAQQHHYDLSSLVTVFSSGGPSPEHIWQEIRDHLRAPEVITGYGMTETTAATVCTYPEGPDRLLRTNGTLREAGVAGDPDLGGVLAVYRVVDPETEVDVPPGERGHFLARGPMITPGYFDKPAETAEAFTTDGWFRTGDIGTIDVEGSLRLTGRLKETYRCGGELVMPREIELLLADHEGVEQAHVVGLPDPRMGEVGCAWIVAREGFMLEEQELIAYCTQHLARFKVPAHVLFTTVEELPLTVTGRVQKFHLVARAQKELNRRTEGV